MRGWPVHVIPNPLDLEFWKPSDRESEEVVPSIDPTQPTVLFAAEGGTRTQNKGFDLLEAALDVLSRERRDAGLGRLQLIVVGNSQPILERNAGFQVIDVGRVRDDQKMRAWYRVADLVAVPSRIESFGQVAAEAQACGTPVVAFRTGGLQDIVVDGETGHLADPFDIRQLAVAIRELIVNRERQSQFGGAARRRMETMVAPAKVASEYFELFKEIHASRPNPSVRDCPPRA
jgi:glycosyltransferase involved in cell wall biosynthesis